MTIDLFSAAGILLIALLLSAVLSGVWLRLVRKAGLQRDVREDVPSSHQAKAGTPSMGGVAIIAAILITGALAATVAARGTAPMVVVVSCALLFGLIGLCDDYVKISSAGAKGILARYRIILQIALGLLAAWLLATMQPSAGLAGSLGFGNFPLELRILLGGLVIAGSANGVNFADGLDGLAGGTCALAGLALACVCWVTGAPGLALMALCIAGAAAGFLWFNCKPAALWMGDVGSLALGAALGAVAVAARVEWAYAVIGAVFVVEVLSVMLQVAYFKATGGKRIFPMTPLHHSFELLGWPETKIVMRFWLAGAIAGLLGILLAVAVVGQGL